jgi:hypothetical protein
MMAWRLTLTDALPAIRLMALAMQATDPIALYMYSTHINALWFRGANGSDGEACIGTKPISDVCLYIFWAHTKW